MSTESYIRSVLSRSNWKVQLGLGLGLGLVVGLVLDQKGGVTGSYSGPCQAGFITVPFLLVDQVCVHR